MKVQSLVSRAQLLKKKLGRELNSTIEILRFHINKKKSEMNKLKREKADTPKVKNDQERRLNKIEDSSLHKQKQPLGYNLKF